MTALAADRLKSFAQRIENLMDERDGIQSDIRDIYAEAKSVGYVPKVLRKAITRKRMDASKRDEEDAILELYEGALSGPLRKAVAMAASGATSREIEQETGIDHATVARSVALNKKSATDAEEVPPVSPHTEREEPNAGLSSSNQSCGAVNSASREFKGEPYGNPAQNAPKAPPPTNLSTDTAPPTVTAVASGSDGLELPIHLRRSLRSQEAAPPHGGNTRDELVQ